MSHSNPPLRLLLTRLPGEDLQVPLPRDAAPKHERIYGAIFGSPGSCFRQYQEINVFKKSRFYLLAPTPFTGYPETAVPIIATEQALRFRLLVRLLGPLEHSSLFCFFFCVRAIGLEHKKTPTNFIQPMSQFLHVKKKNLNVGVIIFLRVTVFAGD